MEVGEQVARPIENSLMEPASLLQVSRLDPLGQEVPSEDGVFRLKECCWTERDGITEA